MRALVATLAALLVLDAARARACAPATRPGEHVGLTAEEAIITWDPARKEEQFIRRATFVSKDATDFGFLVPTPTRPELAEANEAAFGSILLGAEHDVEWIPRRVLGFGCALLLTKSMSVDDARAVRVLEERRIAGYDVAVLQGDSAGAVASWLRQHEYASRPALEAWLAPYVAAGFTISAFRFQREAGAKLPTSSVRMSFKTDRPFFPYREPADAPETADRSLRIYLVAPTRMAATLGETGPKPWGAKLEYARERTDLAYLLSQTLPPDLIPKSAWLTIFLDRATVRDTSGDLFFDPSAETTIVRYPPRTYRSEIFIPIELLVIIAIVVLLVWRAVRRRRRRRARVSTAFTVLLLVGGCSAKGSPAPVADSPGLTLLDRGGTPRRILRFSPRRGDHRTLVYSSGGTTPDGGVTPGFKLRMSVAVTDVAADGTATVETKVTEATPADEPSRQVFGPLLESFRGLTTTEVVSNRGVVLSSRVDPPDKTPFGAGSWILPLNAVGPGARWRVHDLTASGPPDREDPIYELVSMDGQRVTVRVTQHAPPSGLAPSQGMPDFDATGELTDDLATAGIERQVTIIVERHPVARTSRITAETGEP